MSSYWSKFPDFDHKEAAPVQTEFKRLARQQGWITIKRKKKEEIKSTIYFEEWGECLESEFTKYYGDSKKPEGWQALCREVRLKNVPQSITACKKALKTKVRVNIVDLVDCRRTGEPVKRYRSLEALREYIWETDNIFPKFAAKKDGFLAGLLITLTDKPKKPSTSTS
ncbi:hypothetical protein M408DRAFT_169378 [Serendipita vermifera MAFF 305830]|uniref:Uncharacterized protein n=1 Tax=Serendipita vermifera MAFF 305830 TaxID=933852 RepID=A0A0C3B7B3_SERVB|nr:hypothetical protein M408DRAFT_169378 [Serendipita vermifera MAFF 305830]